MGCKRFALTLFASLLLSVSLSAQQTPPTAQRDSQAVTLLEQCLNAAGGTSAIGAIKDFTGTGNITYYWAGEQVTGSVTVRGLGASLFRLDAQLPDGPRSWLVTDLKGSIRKADGTVSRIPYANAINRGSLTLPYVPIAAALTDSSFSVTSVGTATVNGRKGTIVQVQHVFSPQDDPAGDLKKFNARSYVIDSQTFAILETQDTMWSDDGRMRPVEHEVVFSKFTSVNGLSVPFSIEEKLGGQETWSLELDNLVFNTGLADSVFQF